MCVVEARALQMVQYYTSSFLPKIKINKSPNLSNRPKAVTCQLGSSVSFFRKQTNHQEKKCEISVCGWKCEMMLGTEYVGDTKRVRREDNRGEHNTESA